MSGFHFSLEKALDLRRLQLELEESRFQQQAAALRELDRMREVMRASRANAEAQVRAGGWAQGLDLAADYGVARLHALDGVNRQARHPGQGPLIDPQQGACRPQLRRRNHA